MSPALTSWKEIAAYLGKSVRTVQRWEERLHLPVRRPDSANRNVVLAFPAELDDWMKRSLNPRPRPLPTVIPQLERMRELVGVMLQRAEVNRQRTNELMKMIDRSRLRPAFTRPTATNQPSPE